MFSMLTIKDIFNSANLHIRKVLLIVGAVMFLMFWVFLYKAPYTKTLNQTLAQFALFSFMIGFAMFFMGWSTRKIMEKGTLSSIFLLVLMLFVLMAMFATESKPAFKYVWWLRVCCVLSLVSVYYLSMRRNTTA